MANRDEFKGRFSLVRELRDRFVDVVFPGPAPLAAGIVTISGSGTLTTITTINGTAITTAWGVSNTATATAHAAAINANATLAKIVTASSSGANVLIVAKLPGSAGSAITVVVTGTAASTYNYSVASGFTGTLLGGTGAGSPLGAQSIVTLTSASGVVGVTIDGEAVTVTAANGDGPTAAALQAAIAADAVASRYVVAYLGTTSLTNATLILAPTAAFAGTSISVVPTGTGVTVDHPVLSTAQSGLLGWPENQGVKAVYQLNAGYYMLSFDNVFKECMSVDAEFILNSATPPVAVKPWILQDASKYAGSGYLLLSGMSAGDTFTLYGVTFSCVASGAASIVWTITASGSANGEKDSITVGGINCPFTAGSTDTLTATAIAASINLYAGTLVTATSSVGVVTVTPLWQLPAPTPGVPVQTGTGPCTGITITQPVPQFNVGASSYDSNTAINIANAINMYLGYAGIVATPVAIAPSSGHGGAVIISSTTKHVGFSTSSVHASAYPGTGSLQDGAAVFMVTLANAGVAPTDNTSSTKMRAHFVFDNAGNTSNNG